MLLPESYAARQARGSSGLPTMRWLSTVSLLTYFAPANAAAVACSSPESYSNARLPGTSACNCGAPAATAASKVAATGRSRYSTSIKSRASSALAADSATSMATASPTKRTRPCASTGCSGFSIVWPPLPGKFTTLGRDLNPAARASSPVNTAFTPGWASARCASSRTISACARSARRNTAWSCPGRFQSAV